MAMFYKTKMRYMCGLKSEAKALLPLVSSLYTAEAKLMVFNDWKYTKAKLKDKTNHVFGSSWRGYFEKIVKNWINTGMNVGYYIEFIVR